MQNAMFGRTRRGGLKLKLTLVGDIEDDDDAVCASVVRAGDRPETLLASSVPNLRKMLDADGRCKPEAANAPAA